MRHRLARPLAAATLAAALVSAALAGGTGGTSPPQGQNATLLQGRPVSATAPTTSQVLAWSGSAWVPATGGGGGGASSLQAAYDSGRTVQTASAGTPVAITGAGSGVALVVTSGVISSPGAGSGSERFGAASDASGVNATAFGNGAAAAGDNSTAVGYGATVTLTGGNGGTALGKSASASGTSSSALGGGSSAGAFADALGTNTTSSGVGASAVGILATASGDHALSVGGESDATAAFSVALGGTANASASGAMALGYGSTASATNAVAIGNGATASSANTVTFPAASQVLVGTSTPVGTGGLSVQGRIRVLDGTGGAPFFESALAGTQDVFALSAGTSGHEIHTVVVPNGSPSGVSGWGVGGANGLLGVYGASPGNAIYLTGGPTGVSIGSIYTPGGAPPPIYLGGTTGTWTTVVTVDPGLGELTLAGGSQKIGFFGATPAAKPTITGSRGGNAALADLLTQGATLGLWTDSTTP